MFSVDCRDSSSQADQDTDTPLFRTWISDEPWLYMVNSNKVKYTMLKERGFEALFGGFFFNVSCENKY